jgi:hypothetical protein
MIYLFVMFIYLGSATCAMEKEKPTKEPQKLLLTYDQKAFKAAIECLSEEKREKAFYPHPGSTTLLESAIDARNIPAVSYLIKKGMKLDEGSSYLKDARAMCDNPDLIKKVTPELRTTIIKHVSSDANIYSKLLHKQIGVQYKKSKK